MALNPYRDWTMDRLVASNFLRDIPLTYEALTLYAGHKATSLRVAATALRRAGRLGPHNQLLREHPANANLIPLPDLPGLAAKSSNHAALVVEAQRNEALQVVAQVLGANPDTKAKRFTMDELIELTDEYIRSGASGKDFLSAVRARIDLEGIAPPPLGPPPPTTPDTTIQRLHDLLVEVPDALLTTALARRLDTLSARAGLPPCSPDPPPPTSPEAGRSGPSGPDHPPSGPEPDPRSDAPHPGA